MSQRSTCVQGELVSMLATTYSRANMGMNAPIVAVETHISNGLPAFNIVGLPDTAVKESKERVRSALLNSHFQFPARRITVNLAPAELPKDGGRFDLAIALGILAASNQIPSIHLADYEFAGELALSGELRSITAALPFSLACSKANKHLIISNANATEAGLCEKTVVLPADHLLRVCHHLQERERLSPYQAEFKGNQTQTSYPLDLADVYGQEQAKRAIEIAAAGRHSLLFIGSPGTGKTMLASRLPSILPPMTEEESLEYAAVCSISKKAFSPESWRVRPFRSPHHTASSVALVGGGSPPKPGEISLAHHGVLFLDELPEFSRQVLEALREPLESGSVTISRASYQSKFPAKFQFVAAMNPCPCGYSGDIDKVCRCSQDKIERYQVKISGPLLDRIDMHLHVPPLPQGVLTSQKNNKAESSEIVAARVLAAHKRQYMRQNHVNAMLDNQSIEKYACLNRLTQKFLEEALVFFGFSARTYHRILRVARTIADLAGEEGIQQGHLEEAMMLRCLDRKAGM